MKPVLSSPSDSSHHCKNVKVLIWLFKVAWLASVIPSWCLLLITAFSKLGGQDPWRLVVKNPAPSGSVTYQFTSFSILGKDVIRITETLEKN